MDIANFTKAARRDGKLVIEIPEARIVEAAQSLLYDRARVEDRQRLLDHVAAHLTSRQHTFGGTVESALNQLIGETVAEAAHAGAGIVWTDPARHTLLHE